MQPGDTITPLKQSEDAGELVIPRNTEAVTQEVPATTPLAQTPVAEPPQNPEPAPQPSEDQTANEMSPPWQYESENGSYSDQQQQIDIKPVNWSASEFIDNAKDIKWFMGLAAITLAVVVVIYFMTQDLITSVVIIMAAVLFGITAKRKPRTLEYQIDHTGLNIGGKPFPYEIFKSFAVMKEGAFSSIQLMPLKRFMPSISLYYPPESEEQIVTTLGSYLPHEDRTHDPIERLMRRVRF